MPLPEDVVADDPRYVSEHPSHHNQIHAAINGLEALAGTLSDVETTSGSQGKVDTHALDTTSVHGISDTAQLPAKNAANTFTQTQTLNLDMHVKGPTAPWADVKAYGAVGDGVADDAAAIQLAIDAVKTTVGPLRGGTVFFPKGIYKCTVSLNCEQGHGIVFRGVGSNSSANIKGSVLMFTGTGTGRFIDARSAHGFEIRGMHVRYNSASFTGTLIDFGHSIAQDNTYSVIDRCYIGGDAVATATTLIRLHQAIFTYIKNSHIGQGVVGVRLRDDTVGGYSNGHQIENCVFDHLTTSAIANAAEKLTVTNCGFEGTSGVTSGMPRAYTDSGLPADSDVYAVSFIGCWFGDVVNVNTLWLEFAKRTHGIALIGNAMLGSGTGLPNVRFSSTEGCWGITIQGNDFGATNAIDFGTSAKEGIVVAANSFHWCTNAYTNLTGVAHNDVCIFGNRAPVGTGLLAQTFTQPLDVPSLRRSTDAARTILWGSGTPEAVVTASVGSLFLRTDGGAATTLYVKETGTGNTGWAAVGGGGGGATLGANTFTGTQTMPASTLVGAVGISNEGGMRIGGDTYLFRSAAANLKTQHRLDIGDDCYVRVSNAPNYIGIGAMGPSSEIGVKWVRSSGNVNLYASADDVLKTDDKLITVVGLGVGNSAAATTPGSVVRKMEVFDAAGASLGFVPIYSTIT